MSNDEVARLRDELDSARARCRQLEAELHHTVEASLGAASARGEASVLEAERFFLWSRDMLCVAGFDGYFKRLNPAWSKTLGWSNEELLSVPWLEFVHPDDLERTIEIGTTAVGGEVVAHFQNRYRCKDGSYRWLLWSGVPIADESLIYCVVRDITQETADAQSLRESEEAYRMLFEGMLDGFSHHEVIVDEQGEPVDYRFLAVNPAFEEQTGLQAEELVGRRVLEVLPGTEDVWIKRFGQVGLTGEPVRFESFSGAIGKHFEVLAFSPKPGQFACTLQDITARKKAEEEREHLKAQVEHAQKLESLGVLAGGFAHDFNNLLCAIIGGVEVAMMELPEDSLAAKDLDAVVDTASRASSLCGQMLAYAGCGRIEMAPISLSEFVLGMRPLLLASVSKKANLTLGCAPGLPNVLGDGSQLTQIVLNLVINASEALGGTQGSIVVSTGTRSCTEECLTGLHLADGFEPGEYVFLSVEDDGCGMPAKTLEQIFDPFYTTKFTGRGLGLAATIGIVRSHGGALRVVSEEGRGTAFTIFLPKHDVPENAANVEPPARQIRGAGIVLVADDEPAVRSTIARAMGLMGFETVQAGDGREALTVFHEYEDKLALVMLDITMPELGGLEVLEQIQPTTVPVVLMSGYSEGGEHTRSLHAYSFLAKPFTLNTLRQVIAKALELKDAR